MFKKTLERKLVLDSDGELILDEPVELEYFLIESSFENDGCLNESNKTYGFSISRKIDRNCFEENVIRDYSKSFDDARITLDILATNSVTPGSMLQVLDDMLGCI